MTAVAFDTYSFVKRLIASGMPETQAETITTLVREAHEGAAGELATKGDLAMLRRDIEQSELRLGAKIDAAHADTLRWMFASVVGMMAFLVTVLKFWH